MSRRRASLLFPILYAVFGILLISAVMVGWNVILTNYFVLAEETRVARFGVGFWFILAIGDLFLALVVTIVVMFLIGTIRQAQYVRRQNTFMDSVTHELKSPLAGLRLAVDTLQRRELSVEMKERFLGMMREDVDRLQAFIEQLLEAGRLTHRERPIELQRLELPELLERCVEKIRLRHQLEEPSVVLEVDRTDSEAWIVTDPVALETIVMNLLDNAVKYSPEKVEVILRARISGVQLVIEVSDRGIGISSKQLRHVFRRFHRIRHAAASVRGTGLGLFVVSELVRQLGGRVSAESDGEGHGTLLTVNLPLRDRRKGKEPAILESK